MRPEDYDVIAKIIAQKVKEGLEKADTKLAVRIDALEAENKALRDTPVVTADQVRSIDDTLGALTARLDAVDESLSQRSFASLEDVQQIRLDVDKKVNVTDLVKTVDFDEFVEVRTHIGNLEQSLADMEERILDVSKLIPNARAVADTVLELDVFGDLVGKMVGENVEAQLPGLIPEPIHGKDGTSVTLDDVVDVLPNARAVADTVLELDVFGDLVGKMVGENVEAQLPGLIPEPIHGKDGTSVTLDDVVDVLPNARAVADTILELSVFEDLVGKMVDTQLPDLIPEPVVGKDGIDGKDAQVDVDEVVNVVLEHKGFAKLLAAQVPDPVEVDYKAIEAMIVKQMPDSIAPTELQVLDAVRSLWPDIRAVMAKHLPKMEHKGTWDAETQYDVGDEVVKSGSTYRLMFANDNPPPGEGWQLISQGRKGSQGKPGEKGDRGDPGEKGKDGVGIADMGIAEGKMLVVEMTDGEVRNLDQTEFIELIIKAIGE